MKRTDGSYGYWDIVDRNIGVFSKGEQEKILNTKVAIAGIGALGAQWVPTLVEGLLFLCLVLILLCAYLKERQKHKDVF